MYCYEKPDLNDLVHFGVKGMKWGVRKKVESAGVTKAKQTVAAKQSDVKEAQKRINRESKYGFTVASDKAYKQLSNASRELRYAKKDLSSVKILEKLNSKPKSASQIKMEAKYKAKGMSDDEAAVAAYQNIRTKKILAAVGTTALVAGTAYAAYKIRDERVDKIIKSGKTLQNVSTDSSKGIRDAFYASGNKLDNAKYKGLYGETLADQGQGVFKKDIKVLKDIKQASPKNAQKVLEDLISKDKDFANNVQQYIEKNRLGETYATKSQNAIKSLRSGKVSKDVYEFFNASLVDHSPEMQPLTDKYFKQLSDKGYNAIRDVNDKKYSGFKSLNPIITFGSSGKVDVVEVKELAKSEIEKSKKIAVAHIAGTELVKQGSILAATILGGKVAGNKVTEMSEQRIIKNYKKKHPNTKLSDRDIVRTVEGA